MHFGRYLLSKQREEWADSYLDYKGLKGLIKAVVAEERKLDDGALSYSPRTTSLSVQRRGAARDAAEETFFRRLEEEVQKIAGFTQAQVAALEQRLQRLQDRASAFSAAEGAASGSSADPVARERKRQELLAEGKLVGDLFLALEKYVNLNYMGVHKILKKHDKMLPQTPCRQFYIAHLHNQPWVQGNYSSLMVILSSVFSKLRGDFLAEAQGGAAQAFKRHTNKYWIRTGDVSAVKAILIEHMPVFIFHKENYTGDAQLVNSVYFDNDSLELYHGRLDKRHGAIALRIRWYGPGPPKTCFVERKTHRDSWKGERSVKERFTLQEEQVMPYLAGSYTVDQFEADLLAKGKSAEEAAKACALFAEISQQIDSKQLKPFIRTQYMRSAYQMGHDRSVSFTLDTNLCMIKENPEGHPSCAIAGRWFRDPSLPIHRTEVTRFPHAILEIKLALPDGELPPDWVVDLMNSGLITGVHKMSKFIHGTAVLFPDMAVPYWIDDASIRASIESSAAPASPMAAGARDALSISMRESKPRRRQAEEDASGGASTSRHPLLGKQPTLRLLRSNTLGASTRQEPPGEPGGLLGWLGLAPESGTIPQRLEPKTFLASERTFLSWMHMAIVMASIASALLAFAASSKKSSRPMHVVSANLVEIISLILLPLAVLMVAYSTLVFVWRNSQIASKQAGGPLLLACLVVAALSAIFIVSCVDLFDSFQSKAGSGQPGGGALAGSGGGLQLPYTALPKPLSVIQMAGGAGADGSA